MSAQTDDADASSVDSGLSPLDREIVHRAYRKLVQREELTREERSVLRRHEKAKEEQLRWKFYRQIPQKHWRAMSGRQAKVLQEQAALYGLPFGGATIDLPLVVRSLHDFLSTNGRKLLAADTPPSPSGQAGRWLTEYRKERALLTRLERRRQQRDLIPRAEIHESMTRLGAALRQTGNLLERHFGPQAAAMFDHALEILEREFCQPTKPRGRDQSGDDGGFTGGLEQPSPPDA